MELYTGRVDCICEIPSEDVKEIKKFIKAYADLTQHALIFFEDLTKTGLPCKPHLHFLFFAFPKWKHDGMRRDLSGRGYKGSLGALSKVSSNPKHTKEGAYSYTMKQRKCMWTNITKEELQDLQSKADEVNSQCKDKMNAFGDHWKKNIAPTMSQLKYTQRVQFIAYVHSYITKWNKEQQQKILHNYPAEAELQYPTRSALLQYMQQFEAMYLSEELALERYIKDNGEEFYQL